MQELAFLFVAFVFVGGRLQQAIRWTFLVNFVAGLGSLVGVYLVNNITIVVATVLVWAVALVLSAVLLSLFFRRDISNR